MSSEPPRAAPLVVLGPTASGKSDVAMAFARAAMAADVEWGVSARTVAPSAAVPSQPHAAAPGSVELVAVDSMQVYNGMDVGTAKPSATDRSVVVHHCLDLVDPDVDFTVAEFAGHAHAALASIAARGNRAVLVAGTGLYLRSVTDPMEIPGRWPAVREQLERRLVEEGSAAMHHQLSLLDPVAASRMEPSNARRVVRALEVVLGGGRPFSSYGSGVRTFPPTPFVQIGLRWRRERLAERIETRVQRMMEDGLLAEVARLASRPAGWSRTARQALGYKELLDHLDGLVGVDEAVAMTVTRTRQFAVRQERWFRRDPRIRWVLVDDDPIGEVLPILQHT